MIICLIVLFSLVAIFIIFIFFGMRNFPFMRVNNNVPLSEIKKNSQVLLSKGQRVMVVVAHPDDSEFMLGGTLAKLVKNGDHVFLICCTKGGKDYRKSPAEAKKIGERRVREQRNAAKFMGYEEVIFLDFPDGKLKPIPELVSEIGQLYKKYQPEILITFDKSVSSVRSDDHSSAGEAALLARDKGGESVKEVFLIRYNLSNTWIDTTETHQLKMEGLSMHKGEFGGFLSFMLKYFLTKGAENQGNVIGTKYAEALYRIPK